ncbi:E3 ubiquitin-protein ligase MARCH5 [Sugiyamaella lignohabitans]|uniref:E3 ubiquitin-protein ligase MARCH5 n=1 Tax=Sugiyamaella lignohabitans TaxID=796027 RepID=A0A161HKB3_9ASCO|nr:E3 ubiquitin-protein ligase MARCH5 [Sugiyamaella lignohabitans]ANB12058.1 E3 ubiquitin-protein ligase MARCH5 [Sugiyamaella lignohabitans]
MSDRLESVSPGLRPLNQEDYRCWICLGTADEPPPHNQKDHHWCRPCRCNLVSHQTCLLEWAAEVASTNPRSLLYNSGPKTPQCPQCKSAIHIAKSKSLFIQLRDRIEAANASGFQLFFVTVIGGSIASAVYTSLYALGAASIRCICPRDMALPLLGISVTDQFVQIQPLSVRRMLLVPSIPIVLLLSGSRSTFADVVTLLMPLTLSDGDHLPWKLTGPRLTMALLPLARIGYHVLYDSLVEPIIQLCAARIRPSFSQGLTGRGDGEGAGVELAFDDDDNNGGPLRALGVNFEIVLHDENAGGAGDDPAGNIGDGIADEDGNNDNMNGLAGAGPDQAGRRGGRVGQRRNILTLLLGRLGVLVANALDRAVLPAAAVDNAIPPVIQDDDAIPPVGQDQVNGNLDDPLAGQLNNANQDNNNNNNNNIANGQAENNNGGPADARLVRRQRAADWVFSSQGWSLRAGNTLLLPLFSGIMGSGLSLIPAFRRLVPDKFNRNIIGGMLIIVLRDLVNIATALLRVRQENSRRVLDYVELAARGLD